MKKVENPRPHDPLPTMQTSLPIGQQTREVAAIAYPRPPGSQPTCLLRLVARLARIAPRYDWLRPTHAFSSRPSLACHHRPPPSIVGSEDPNSPRTLLAYVCKSVRTPGMG